MLSPVSRRPDRRCSGLRSTLLRALLFRKGAVISGDDLGRALAVAQKPVAAATEQSQLRTILSALQAGDGDFWTLVHKPFTDNRLTSDTVHALIDEARRGGARNMPEVALALRACDPHSDSAKEQRRFYKFKNFLYKTEKI